MTPCQRIFFFNSSVRRKRRVRSVLVDPTPVESWWTSCVAQGKSLFVTYKAIGELKPDGMREVFFELNGIPRTVEVFDEKVTLP